jgi:putative transposase
VKGATPLLRVNRDDDVLEMYDQPTRIQLHYQARSGRKTSPWHTPDFLVLRRASASFEEWKHASSLDKLVTSQPHRYQRNASGGWQCPPGEQAAKALGLSYRVRSSAEYHPLYIQNLKFLQDFWVKPFHVEAAQESRVLESLQAYPGVSVKSLLDAHPDLPVDVVWAMIVKQSLFTDLSAAALTSWDQVFLYRSAAEVASTSGEHQDGKGAIPLTSRLLWDGRLWEAEVEATTVVLRPESGTVFTLTLEHFQRLVNEGVIKPERLETPSPLRNSTREILSRAGPKTLEAANRRWHEILAYTRGEAITVTARSVQNWMAAFRRAEAESGCGYLGLLDRVAECICQ